MKKIIFIFTTIIMLLCACSSSRQTGSLSTKSKQLQLGMTKNEAALVMGTSYQILSSAKTEEGNKEVIRYVSSWPPNYILHFIDDRLIEWQSEK